MGTKTTELIQYLKTRLEFPSKNVERQLTDYVTELYNSTRQYVLKGITPRELHLEESVPVLTVDLKKHIKIGRNDPCPCGSGLKYKKCCGR